MDNVCHTLVGAALGEAGLKQRTRFGNATLMIAANVPDIDVFVFATDTPSVAFRRGWTHGILAQAVLPIVVTGVIWLVARGRPGRRDEPLHLRWVLALSYLGVYSHVFLDLLNNYGVRLLAPVDWRWLYGDSVFIIDPWLWLALGGGIWLARRRSSAAPARHAIIIALVYIGAMVVSARFARDIVIDAWRAEHGRTVERLMVGPLPVTPLQRAVIVDAGDHYDSGTFTWWPTRVTFDAAPVPKNDARPEVASAREAPNVRAFLVWSRFPYWTLEPAPGGTRVTVADMRFMAGGVRFSASTVVPN
jgi:inner membrane protein